MMALSGVRSSWLMVDRKVDLERLLSSASARAARMARSVYLRSCISPKVSEYLASRRLVLRERAIRPGLATAMRPPVTAKSTSQGLFGRLTSRQAELAGL